MEDRTRLWEELHARSPLAWFLVDRDGRLVGANPAAWRHFGWPRQAWRGLGCAERTGCAAVECRCRGEAASGRPFPAPWDGNATALATPVGTDGALFAVAVLGCAAPARDALTGLEDRRALRRVGAAGGGAVLLLDLDGMKEINDLWGHGAGDAVLRHTAGVLADSVGPGELAVRWGGDEFLVVLPGADLTRARVTLERIRRRLDSRGALPEDYPLSISCGVGIWGPEEEPEAAVERADGELYRDKGVLLVHASGTVRLTEAGRRTVSELEREVAADWELSRQQAAYVARFNQAMELDELFRAFFTRYAEFPRDFLDWAGVGRGAAVLEAGCGGGRLTFEGGLAERVGPQGLVLAADPSVAMLRQAWRKREERGLSHVYFLKAPAERLPVRDAQADWAVGMNFFHYTHRERALRELLRVTRPGGRVALVVGVGVEYPAAGARAMALLREALARRGLGPPQDYLDPPGATARLFRRMGLEEVAAVEASEEGVFTDFEMAFRYLTQVSYLDSHLEALGEGETVAKLRLALLAALEEGFKEATPAQRVAVGRYEFVRGRVPGGPEEPEGGGGDEDL